MPDVILAFYTNKRVFFFKADTSLAVNADWICYSLRLVYTGFIKLLTSGRFGINPGLSTQPHSSVNMLIIWALHHWDLLWSPSTHGNVCPVLRLLVEITARPPRRNSSTRRFEHQSWMFERTRDENIRPKLRLFVWIHSALSECVGIVFIHHVSKSEKDGYKNSERIL